METEGIFQFTPLHERQHIIIYTIDIFITISIHASTREATHLQTHQL